jgi:hypothetical protein
LPGSWAEVPLTGTSGHSRRNFRPGNKNRNENCADRASAEHTRAEVPPAGAGTSARDKKPSDHQNWQTISLSKNIFRTLVPVYINTHKYIPSVDIKHTKPKRVGNVLSVSPFFVFDDNTRICKHNTYYDKITIVQR